MDNITEASVSVEVVQSELMLRSGLQKRLDLVMLIDSQSTQRVEEESTAASFHQILHNPREEGPGLA